MFEEVEGKTDQEEEGVSSRERTSGGTSDLEKALWEKEESSDHVNEPKEHILL